MLTFEPWKEKSILIRFEHILSKDEDAEYSKNVTFNFEDVFRNLGVASIRETTLAANQWLSDAVRMQFISETQSNGLQSSINEIAREQRAEHQMSNSEIHPEISHRQYRKNTHKDSQRGLEADTDSDVFKITLQPMQIRTFILDF